VKVLVDTNVVLDVLLAQEPHCKNSAIVLQLAYGGHISGILAAVSVTNIFYILRRHKKTCDECYQLMDKLNAIFKFAPITETTVTTALALRWNDFEDAVQFITAKESKIDFIITRNKDDFDVTDITCMTPTEFITFLEEKEKGEN
jgi:predicted nucleic acid-binding protein